MNIVVYTNNDFTKTTEGININSGTTILDLLFKDKNIKPYFFQEKDIKTNQDETFKIQLYEYDPSKIISQDPYKNKFEKAKITIDEMDKLVCKKDEPPKPLIYFLNRKFKDKKMINKENMFKIATKEYVSQFDEFTPYTQISENLETIIKEMKSMKEVIIKPNNGDRGRGIIKAKYDNDGRITIYSTNNKTTKKVSEQEFKDHLRTIQTTFGDNKLILQEYLDQVTKGDKRILLMITEKEIMYQGISLRVPQNGSYLANIYQGGMRVGLPKITKQEIKMMEEIAPKLLNDGIYMVGIDMINEQLMEINSVNPGFKLTKKELIKSGLEKKIIKFIQQV